MSSGGFLVPERFECAEECEEKTEKFRRGPREDVIARCEPRAEFERESEAEPENAEGGGHNEMSFHVHGH